jgi:hypothetical protein
VRGAQLTQRDGLAGGLGRGHFTSHGPIL